MAQLKVDNLSIVFNTRHGCIDAVNDVSFSIERGETLAIVGESGSGKSVTCYSLLGLLPMPPAKIVSGVANFKSESGEIIDLLQYHQRKNFLRSQQITTIFQDPSSSLNPYLTIGEQVIEPLLYGTKRISRPQAKEKAIELLDEVGIRHPQQCFDAWPHQLSGGMNQRVMIAMALIAEPQLLIADEPTTALDVTIQAQILELLKKLQQRRHLSIIFISHDLSIVANIADNIVVMQQGKIVESGHTKTIFKQTQHTYTQQLIAAIPSTTKSKDSAVVDDGKTVDSAPLIQVDNLVVSFKCNQQIINAVDRVSLTINEGQLVGLVGESGSGKSTLGRALLRLIPNQGGSIVYAGQELNTLSQKQMRPLRRYLQMVFQDPYASLNPRMTLFETLAEPLLLHNLAQPHQVADAVKVLLDDIELPHSLQHRYPHQFSGGQRQRIVIGRAIACRPHFIVADEAVSALDVTIQKQILDLLSNLVQRYNLTLLFISHDLAVVRAICDQVLVMQHGVLVERGDTQDLFNQPQHAYTQQLLAAIPRVV